MLDLFWAREPGGLRLEIKFQNLSKSVRIPGEFTRADSDLLLVVFTELRRMLQDVGAS